MSKSDNPSPNTFHNKRLNNAVYTFLPDNLDLDSLVMRLPPVEFPNFKLSKFKYLLGLIETVPLKNKKYSKDQNGYTYLNSKKMKPIDNNYKKYLQLAKDLGIIVTDGYWIEGKKSIGYKFSEEYQNKKLKKIAITSPKISKQLSKQLKENQKAFSQKEYLVKSYNEHLRVDISLLRKKIEEIYASRETKGGKDINHSKTRQERFGTIIYKNPEEQYSFDSYCADMIESFEWRPYLDSTAGRLHSSLTNQPSYFRDFLTYKGEQLVSLDIENSQPYLLLRLLHTDYYFKHSESSKSNRIINPFKQANTIINDKHIKEYSINPSKTLKRAIYSINKSIYKQNTSTIITSNLLNTSNKRVKYFNYIKNITETSLFTPSAIFKCIETVKNIDLEEFRQYSELVSNGRFYEQFAEQIEVKDKSIFKDEIDVKKKRKIVKEIMYTVLFGQNDSRSHSKTLFRKAFPTIYKVVKKLKEDNYKFLAITLQRIEAFLVLDVICKRFAKEFPEAPILTIHDSVATTLTYENDLRRIMEEELKFHIGIAPSIKSEYWDNSRFRHDEYYHEHL